MVFVVEGKLLYQWHDVEDVGPGTPSAVKLPGYKRRSRYLQQGDWCCEACLWADWVHHGTMQAVDISKLLAIDTAKFLSVTMTHTMVVRKTALYAQKFIEDLNRTSTQDLNDLSKSREEIEQIAMETF